MVVYEITHLFYRFEDEPLYSPKSLGLYYSLESVRKAVEYFNTQPGFCDNQNAYSVRARDVMGNIANDIVFEVLVHIHSEDYEFETEIELGLYGDEFTAQNELDRYCRDNEKLLDVQDLVFEKIINKCVMERKYWEWGFTVEVN